MVNKEKDLEDSSDSTEIRVKCPRTMKLVFAESLGKQAAKGNESFQKVKLLINLCPVETITQILQEVKENEVKDEDIKEKIKENKDHLTVEQNNSLIHFYLDSANQDALLSLSHFLIFSEGKYAEEIVPTLCIVLEGFGIMEKVLDISNRLQIIEFLRSFLVGLVRIGKLLAEKDKKESLEKLSISYVGAFSKFYASIDKEYILRGIIDLLDHKEILVFPLPASIVKKQCIRLIDDFFEKNTKLDVLRQSMIFPFMKNILCREDLTGITSQDINDFCEKGLLFIQKNFAGAHFDYYIQTIIRCCLIDRSLHKLVFGKIIVLVLPESMSRYYQFSNGLSLYKSSLVAMETMCKAFPEDAPKFLEYLRITITDLFEGKKKESLVSHDFLEEATSSFSKMLCLLWTLGKTGIVVNVVRQIMNSFSHVKNRSRMERERESYDRSTNISNSRNVEKGEDGKDFAVEELDLQIVNYVKLLGRICSEINDEQITSLVVPTMIMNIGYPLLERDLCILDNLGLLGQEFVTKDVVSVMINLYKKISRDGDYGQDLEYHIQCLSNAFRKLTKSILSYQLKKDIASRLMNLFRQLIKTTGNSKDMFTDNALKAVGYLLALFAPLIKDLSQNDIVRPNPEHFEFLRNIWFLCVLFRYAIRGAWRTDWYNDVLEIGKKIAPLVFEQSHILIKVNLEIDNHLNSNLNWFKDISFLRQQLNEAIPGASQHIRALTPSKVVFLLSVYLLEVNRACTGEFRAILLYLEKSITETAGVKSCLRLIADEVFEQFLLRIESKRNSDVIADTCHFLLINFCSCEEEVRKAADSYISQMASRFPEILWHRTCLHTLMELLDVVGKGIELSPGQTTHVKLQNSSYHIDLSEDSQGRKRLLGNLVDLCNVWLKTGVGLAHIETQLVLQDYISSYSNLLQKHIGLNSALNSILNDQTSSGSANIISEKSGGAFFISFLQIKCKFVAEVAGLLEYHGDSWKDKYAESLIQSFAKIFQRKQNGELSLRDEESDEEFFCVLFKACALLVTSDGLLPQNQSNLLYEIAWTPVLLFSVSSMKAGVMAWSWLFVEKPALENSLMCEIAHVWEATISQRIGLFSSSRRKSNPLICSGSYNSTKNIMKFEREKSYLVDGDNVGPHSIWISFLSERCVVHQIGWMPSSFADILTQMLIRAVASENHFSILPDSVVVRYQLLLLCLRILQSGYFVHTYEENAFRENIYYAAVCWFKESASWYDPPNTNHHRIAENVQYMIDVCKLLAAETFFDPKQRRAMQDLRTSKKERKRTITVTSLNADTTNLTGFGSVRRFQGLQQQLDSERSTPDHSDEVLDKSFLTRLDKIRKLLLLLLGDEISRICAWHNPLNRLSLQIEDENTFTYEKLSSALKLPWNNYVEVAWLISPMIAVNLGSRFFNVNVKSTLGKLVLKKTRTFVDIPEAIKYLVTEENVHNDIPQLEFLLSWAPVDPPTAISFFHKTYCSHPLVVQYATRVLKIFSVETIILYLGQLVQCLRYDSSGMLKKYLVEAASKSEILAHQLIWNFQTYILDPSMPNLKLDPSFSKKASEVRELIVKGFSPRQRDMFEYQNQFFESFTDISGELVSIPPNQRKSALKDRLRKVSKIFHQNKTGSLKKPASPLLYLPTDPDKIIVDIDIESATPLPSAEKVPILVNFIVRCRKGTTEEKKRTMTQGCIFKFGDDIRQDMLAVQNISLFKRIFESVGLDVYLFPYQIIATKPECGLIELVPKTMSRDALGKKTEGDMHDYFLRKYGGRNTIEFQEARKNFILSMAAYAVASFILQVKDRHNGNILLDEDGHIVHIDFGFLYDSSPGGNFGFEKSPFKLTGEMMEIMGGSPSSEQFLWFMELGVKAFLAVRNFWDVFVNLTDLMVDTKLPCFFDKSIINLKNRFFPDNHVPAASKFFAGVMVEAFSTKGTFFTYIYDKFQLMDNGIDM